MSFCDSCLAWVDDPELCDDCYVEDWLYDRVEDYYYYYNDSNIYDNEGENYND